MNNKAEKNSEKSILSQLRELEIGHKLVFPAEKSSYVKSACTRFGFEWNKKFSTTQNTSERTFTVCRTA